MNKLKEIRLQSKKNLTLDDVALGTGINRATLSRYENSNTEPKLSALKKLAVYYKVPVPELMGIDKVNELMSDIKKANDLIDEQANRGLSQQLKRIGSSTLSNDDKLVLSKAMQLTMNIQQDYSESDKELVANFNSIIEFMLSSTRELTDDDDIEEENDWFEKSKQENIKKFDGLAIALNNNRIKAQNKKASDDKPETEG